MTREPIRTTLEEEGEAKKAPAKKRPAKKSAPAQKALEEVAEQVAEIRAEEPIPVQVAIARVMRDLPAIGKDSTAPGSMGGYTFRGIEQITTVLKPIMAKHGLVIIPQADTIVIDPAPGQKEMWQDVMVRFGWQIVGPDGSFLMATTYGIGRDHTDKGANKAASQAFKYLLMQLFCISDSNADSDGHEYAEVEPVQREPSQAERQVDGLMERLRALKDDPPTAETIKEWAHSQDKKLSPAALLEDQDWRQSLITMLDEIDDDKPTEDEHGETEDLSLLDDEGRAGTAGPSGD